MATRVKDLEDAQAHVEEFRGELQFEFDALLDDLECADNCEDPKDFVANVREVSARVETMGKKVREFIAAHLTEKP